MRLKAAATDRSLSDLVNTMIRERLAEDPRPPGAEKLTGDEKYRLRQGRCRILYTIEEAIVTVTIVRVGHRRDVYR